MQLWNHPPHDRDFVAVMLPSSLRRAISELHFGCRNNFVSHSIQNQRSPTKMMDDLIVIAMLGRKDQELRPSGVQNWQIEIQTFRDIDESADPKRQQLAQPQGPDQE